MEKKILGAKSDRLLDSQKRSSSLESVFRPERISQSSRLLTSGGSLGGRFRPERISQSSRLVVLINLGINRFRPERISQSSRLKDLSEAMLD